MKTPIKALQFKMLIVMGMAILIAHSSRAVTQPPSCVCDCALYEGSDQYVRQAAVYTTNYTNPNDPSVYYGHNDWVGTVIETLGYSDIGVFVNMNYYALVVSGDPNVMRTFDTQGMRLNTSSRTWIWSGPPGTDPGAKGNISISGSLVLSISTGNSNAIPNTTVVGSWALCENDIGAWAVALSYPFEGSSCFYGVNAQITSCEAYARNTPYTSYAYPGDPGDTNSYYDWVHFYPGTTYTAANSAFTGSTTSVAMSHNWCIAPGSQGYSGEALCYAYFHVSDYAQCDVTNSYVTAYSEIHNYAGITMNLSGGRCN